MGAINEYSFEHFTSAIKHQLGKGFEAKVEENLQGLKSIFDEAARNDGGENDELFETCVGRQFDELVKKGGDFVIKTIFVGNAEKLKVALEKLFGKKEETPLQIKVGDGTLSDAEIQELEKYNLQKPKK